MQPMLTQHRGLKTAEIHPLDENANPDYTLAVPDDSISNIQHYDKISVLVFQQTQPIPLSYLSLNVYDHVNQFVSVFYACLNFYAPAYDVVVLKKNYFKSSGKINYISPHVNTSAPTNFSGTSANKTYGCFSDYTKRIKPRGITSKRGMTERSSVFSSALIKTNG
jgi:hypothetical protein